MGACNCSGENGKCGAGKPPVVTLVPGAEDGTSPLNPRDPAPGRPGDKAASPPQDTDGSDVRRQLEDGSVYQGQCRDGLFNGEVYTYANGAVYEGEYKEDMKDGKGRLICDGSTLAEASTYEGDWANDLQDGQGIERWGDGSIFTGSFKDGRKHGHGKFMWGEGCMYEGNFQNNDMHGEGRYVWADGRQFNGDWMENQMHGSGTMRWPDGRIFEGEFSHGKKEGEGTLTWPDGRTYEGQWVTVAMISKCVDALQDYARVTRNGLVESIDAEKEFVKHYAKGCGPNQKIGGWSQHLGCC